MFQSGVAFSVSHRAIRLACKPESAVGYRVFEYAFEAGGDRRGSWTWP